IQPLAVPRAARIHQAKSTTHRGAAPGGADARQAEPRWLHPEGGFHFDAHSGEMLTTLKFKNCVWNLLGFTMVALRNVVGSVTEAGVTRAFASHWAALE